MKVKPYRIEGVSFGAFREQDATIKNHTLAADTQEAVTIPAGATLAMISADEDIWYNLSATAAIPTADTGTSSYLSKGTVDYPLPVGDAASISMIAPAVAHVVVKFYE